MAFSDRHESVFKKRLRIFSVSPTRFHNIIRIFATELHRPLFKGKKIMRRPLTTTQSVILALLWVAICFLILTGSQQIDGPLILTILISGALVFIPITKSIKNKEK